MFSFLKSIKLPFPKRVIACLSIVAIVLVILYLSGLTIYKTKPIWETYEEAPESVPESVPEAVPEPEAESRQSVPVEQRTESVPEETTFAARAEGVLNALFG